MSTLALPGPDLRDAGVGDDAERDRARSRDAVAADTAVSVGVRWRRVTDALRDAVHRADAPDRDGHRAAAHAASVLHAARFLQMIVPRDVPLPEVGVDPEAEVLLEWYAAPRWVVTLTIDPAGVVHYAGLFGEAAIHGREPLVDAIPELVEGMLERYKAGAASDAA